ncbi:MAG: DUF3422 domain-containing protein [Sphingomonadales bacterium]|nr:DUF3422 domain-containing protein [Sphingomonadales bacterium]
MHDRCLPLEGSPARVRQWLFTHHDEAKHALEKWLASNQQGGAASDQSRAAAIVGRTLVIWERHNEFSTITAVCQGRQCSEPIEAVAWLDGFPGDLFRSIEILVGKRTDFDWEREAQFDRSRLVSSYVFDGAARIWSDFTIRDNGGGRIMVEDLGLQNDEAARLVQSLIEIGNYRKLALLGFPVARDLMPWIDDVEARHSRITESHNLGEADSGEILGQLSALSAEVEFRAGLARFRLGATSSYHLLTTDRIRSLRETRIAGHSTVVEFVERRLLPAMRTCEIAQKRLESLSERINRTASLLSLEQTTELNRKNQAILVSLNKRSAMQLRLQNLVEGFSVFAISYYIIAIAEKLIKPLENWLNFSQYDLLLPAFALLTILGTWRHLSNTKRAARVVMPLSDQSSSSGE